MHTLYLKIQPHPLSYLPFSLSRVFQVSECQNPAQRYMQKFNFANKGEGGRGELGVFKKKRGHSCKQCQGEHWKTMLKLVW